MEAKVKKFVMLSSVGADAPEEAKQPKEYLKAKHNVDEYLKSSSVPYTIVRPGALTNEKGSGKISLGKSLPKEGSISRADVAQVLSRVLHDDAPKNETFELLSGDTIIGEAIPN